MPPPRVCGTLRAHTHEDMGWEGGGDGISPTHHARVTRVTQTDAPGAAQNCTLPSSTLSIATVYVQHVHVLHTKMSRYLLCPVRRSLYANALRHSFALSSGEGCGGEIDKGEWQDASAPAAHAYLINDAEERAPGPVDLLAPA